MPNEHILNRLRMRVSRRQAEQEAAAQDRNGDTRRRSNMQIAEGMQVEAKMKASEAKAHGIAEEIRAGNNATREMFKQRLQARIDVQRELQQTKIATSMQNQRIREGQTEGGMRGVAMGTSGGRPSEGTSASNDFMNTNAKGGRHKEKGKGNGKASGEQDAICRLLAIKPPC